MDASLAVGCSSLQVIEANDPDIMGKASSDDVDQRQNSTKPTADSPDRIKIDETICDSKVISRSIQDSSVTRKNHNLHDELGNQVEHCVSPKKRLHQNQANKMQENINFLQDCALRVILWAGIDTQELRRGQKQLRDPETNPKEIETDHGLELRLPTPDMSKDDWEVVYTDQSIEEDLETLDLTTLKPGVKNRKSRRVCVRRRRVKNTGEIANKLSALPTSNCSNSKETKVIFQRSHNSDGQNGQKKLIRTSGVQSISESEHDENANTIVPCISAPKLIVSLKPKLTSKAIQTEEKQKDEFPKGRKTNSRKILETISPKLFPLIQLRKRSKRNVQHVDPLKDPFQPTQSEEKITDIRELNRRKKGLIGVVSIKNLFLSKPLPDVTESVEDPNLFPADDPYPLPNEKNFRPKYRSRSLKGNDGSGLTLVSSKSTRQDDRPQLVQLSGPWLPKNLTNDVEIDRNENSCFRRFMWRVRQGWNPFGRRRRKRVGCVSETTTQANANQVLISVKSQPVLRKPRRITIKSRKARVAPERKDGTTDLVHENSINANTGFGEIPDKQARDP